MNRSARRHLERRCDRALARARGRFVSYSPSTDVALVTEIGTVNMLDGRTAPITLLALGLGAMVDEIADFRAARPGLWLPAVVIIGDGAYLASIPVGPLSPGGSA